MNPRILIRQNPNRFLRLNGVETWSKQNAIIDSVFNNRETSVRSCNAIGKTFTAAALSLSFLLAYESALVITTAPTYPQVEQILWREIHRINAHAKQPFVPFSKMNAISINLGEDHYATGRSTNLESNFQGYHDKNILFIVDEGNGVADEIFTAIKGSTQENAHLLTIGNPIVPRGYFYESFKNDDVVKMHISAYDSPNVTGEKHIPGLADLNWINERKKEWGETSNIYQSRVLGEFPTSFENSFFVINSVVYCMTHEIPPIRGRKSLGVDVARKGNDETVFVEVDGNVATILQRWSKNDIVAIQNYIKAWQNQNPEGTIGVDDLGVGGGVTDNCRADDVNVIPFVASAAARSNLIFENLKAESMWQLSEAITSHEIILPKDDTLKIQFADMRKDYSSRGKIKCVDPDDSPDILDALNIAFWVNKVTSSTFEVL